MHLAIIVMFSKLKMSTLLKVKKNSPEGKSINSKKNASPFLSQDDLHLDMLRGSGVFSAEWYVSNYIDVKDANIDPIEHYYYQGWREGRDPNYIFSSSYYLENNPDVAAAGKNPLIHYLEFGEKEGRSPSIYFDSAYYKEQVKEKIESGSLLAHYIAGGWRYYAPNPFFDNKFYIQSYQDISDANSDPLLHYITHGWREAREFHKFYSFDSYKQELAERLGEPTEPLAYYLRVGRKSNDQLPKKNAPRIVEGDDGFRKSLELHQSAGDYFEGSLIGTEAIAALSPVRTFALYLPQFYPFKENNEWWGPGFTEWRNVTRAQPRFDGHVQPRLPRDLGFYDLRNIETIREQVQLAQQSGVNGFCFYYYWFNRTRLLDRPLDLFLEHTDIQFPFSLMWANENWTRRWDGLENDVLMGQDYKDEDDEALVDDLARYFVDARYEKVEGRPLFFIYRPGIIPNFKARLKKWRNLFKQRHQINPLILMAQGFGDTDPVKYGLDGAIEFPPHKLAVDLPTVNKELKLHDSEFAGHYMRYDDLISRSLDEPPPPFELIKTLVPSWDNEARKPGRGMGFVGASPEKYERWLKSLARRAVEHPLLGKQPYVFINAWNEWAEGALLEPDLHYGYAYLNATFRALTNTPRVRKPTTSVLVVGHDAYLHGAQLLTLNIIRALRTEFGVQPTLLLLDGGPLVAQYRVWADVIVLNEQGNPPRQVLEEIAAQMPGRAALCNTVVTGELVRELSELGFNVVSLVHELSTLIRERGLEPRAKHIAQHASKVVFASEFVKNSFYEVTGFGEERSLIKPQGIYQKVAHDASLRPILRERIGAQADDRIIINMGYGDLRKGFDLFVQTARLMASQRQDCHFVWLGAVQTDLQHWLAIDMNREPLKGRLHILPFDKDVNTYLNGADVYALTSREDPFPSVVLEALCCGLPVVAFQGGGGYGEAIQAVPGGGELVPMGDVTQMANALNRWLDTSNSDAPMARAKAAHQLYDWREYVFGLLELLMPSLKRVSVVVPNYNYARYLPERLGSIFNQTYPIYEVLFLDDKSSDDSVVVAQQVAEQYKREMGVVLNAENSGSVFKQWEKATKTAGSEYLWIAEADDAAELNFVEEIISSFENETVLGFSDSKQIGTNSEHLGDSYHFYLKDLETFKDNEAFAINSQDFARNALCIKNCILNVSAVIFKRSVLENAFQQTRRHLVDYKVAGDWYLYTSISLNSDAKVTYVNKSLNAHRRHQVSATHSLNIEKHIKEIKSVQNFVASKIKLDTKKSQQAKTYLEEVTQELRSRV